MEYDVWKFIAYDKVPVRYPVTKFYQESQESNFKAVTGFTEAEIIDYIYSKRFEILIHEEIGFIKEEVSKEFEVSDPIIKNKNTKPGDFDIVVWNKNRPENAVTIEVKCIKAETLISGETKFNKEKNVTKGITQANAYLKYKFFKTFLLIIILDNGEKVTNKNQFFKDSDLKNSERLFNDNVLSNLNKDVGLLYLKITQTTGKSIYERCNISILKEREATQIKQSLELTEKIKQLKGQ